MVAWTGVCFLVLVAPFEALQPLVRLPGQSLTTVEIALVGVLASWVIAAAVFRQRPQWRTPLTLPWLAVMAASLVAACLAPVDRANAIHMASRSALAFGVFLVTVSGVTTQSRLRGVLIAATVIGVVISAVVVLEFLGVRAVLQALRLFRPGVAVVGSQVRAAGPFQYPTIASMYLEIVFAFTLGLLPAAVDSKRLWQVAAVIAALALIAEAVVLTFTRAGLLTITASLLVVAAVRYRRSGLDNGALAVALVAAIVAVELLSSRSVDTLRLRLTTEGLGEWYQASIEAPLSVSLPTGGMTAVPISVTNTGRTTWDSAADHPFRLSYHWLRDDGIRVAEWEGVRTLFAEPVAPGTTLQMRAVVRAPGEPGSFRLLWDIEQEDQLWFSSEPGAALVETQATVSGPLLSPLPPSRIQVVPRLKARPGRLVLWRAAMRMLAAHPVIGVGPDNFRLEYGTYAGIANADSRVHSNNMYLEVLVGSGLVGGIAFFWFGWRAFTRVLALLAPDAASLGAGVAAAVIAIAAHGVVDAFLGFTATYTLFAITLGLALTPNTIPGTHAHRL
jgi:O-antigen ligase/polysaccharide polymerase Wzy-like membrane protein